MRLRNSALAVVLAMLAVACSDDTGDPQATIPPAAGAESALASVEELVDAVNDADFADASRLAIPDQAALASLAEGATYGVVAEALRTGDSEIAANFWAGFAQGTGNFLAGSVDLSEDDPLTEGDVVFSRVTVMPDQGDSRSILVRDVDGYRIDLFASFGPGLADKMMVPVERLLTTQTEDARLILVELKEIVPSLLAATQLPGNSSDVNQQLLALVEIITRVS